MDASDRARYKQLALDTIIASPVHSKEAQLAEALEKCVDELEDMQSECPTCSYCDNHGDYEYDGDDDSVTYDEVE